MRSSLQISRRCFSSTAQAPPGSSRVAGLLEGAAGAAHACSRHAAANRSNQEPAFRSVKRPCPLIACGSDSGRDAWAARCLGRGGLSGRDGLRRARAKGPAPPDGEHSTPSPSGARAVGRSLRGPRPLRSPTIHHSFCGPFPERDRAPLVADAAQLDPAAQLSRWSDAPEREVIGSRHSVVRPATLWRDADVGRRRSREV
jgi:hypothetical protein